MQIRVLDLDGSVTSQQRVLRMFQPEVHDLRRWGPRLRMACRWNRFYRFERRLDSLLGIEDGLEPAIHLLGSGDFHHLTLALLRRQRHPFNLLVIDKHPGWHRGLPMLHCGGWLHHAARLPMVRRIFHVGGDANFDDAYRWLMPRHLLESKKIVVLPATRQFERGPWRGHSHHALRKDLETPIDRDRLEDLLWPHLDELDHLPLYVSLDKDSMWMPESIANWDSGRLDLTEVQEILQFFLKASGNDLLGMDISGDWSRVETQGIVPRLMHRFQHPRQKVDGDQARICNERTNLMLLRFLAHDPVAEGITFPSRLKSA